jgi:signal transduction histidine kinase/ligand-binding sensor domain-containing protein
MHGRPPQANKCRLGWPTSLAVALLLLFNFAIRAETLPFTPYTMADGLAHDRVDRIVRDSVGFLWFCTNEGLSRFDGYEFKNYTQDDGLPHRSIRAFLETREHLLWLGTGDGAVLFDPHGKSRRDHVSEGQPSSPMFRVFRPSPHANGHPAEVEDLIEDRNGTIWVATTTGVYRLIGSGHDWRLERFDIPAAVENKNENFYRLLEDRSGHIWAATESGLYRISPDRTTITTIHPLLRVGSMIEDRHGRVWIGSVGGTADGDQIGLHLYNIVDGRAEKTGTFRQRDGLFAETWLNALMETSDGRILVGIGNALSEFVPDAGPGEPSFHTLTTEGGVVALGEDVAGNIWYSTNSSGVRRFKRGGFVNFSQSDNLDAKRITSIVSSSDGNIYILAEVNKIYRFDGKKFTAVEPREMLVQSWGRGTISFRDHTGAWWIAGAAGLQRYPSVEKLEDLAHTRPLRIYTTRDGLFTDVIFRLLEDSRGDVWIGSIGHPSDTLTRWERSTETIHQYTAVRDGLPISNPVTALAEDRGGNIWIGLYAGGLLRYRRHDGKFDTFTAEDHLPPGYIGNIFADSAGRIWVATSHGGAVRIDDPTAARPLLTNVTTENGLSSNQTTCTTEDNFGRIYISTGRGVNRLDLQTGRIKIFTRADGLPDNIITQCNREKSGALWFGTWNGVARYEPSAESGELPPSVLLSNLRVNGNPVGNFSQLGETALENLEFTSDQRQVQIDFFALAFGAGESMRYQYKLDGIDSDWSEPSPQRMVNLNLTSGNYTFLVRAINAEGVASATPARLTFSIARPVWQRWWFLLLVALAIAATAYFIYRYRLAQLLKLERVRTRIATDLHDDIGSSLSQIAILSEVARHKAGENGAAEPLRRIADTSRDLVDSMSDIVWAINPQKDHLSDLVQRMRRFAGDTFDATDVAYRFQFDDAARDLALGADLRREVYLIFKECVNNAAKHSSATDVDMSVRVVSDRLVVSLRDNGRGFDVAEAFNGEIKGYGGNGLLNMRRRAERLGGEMRIESQKGEGTTVTLSIPTSGIPARSRSSAAAEASLDKTT